MKIDLNHATDSSATTTERDSNPSEQFGDQIVDIHTCFANHFVV